MDLDQNTYFAAKKPEDLAQILNGKIGEWTNSILSNGFLEKLRSAYACYHGAYYTDTGNGHQISFSGEQGELVNFAVNHWRNIADHMLVMTTSNRPAMDCRATNTDYKSLVQTYLANSILDYYLREKKLEVFLKKAVEYAIVYGSGFVVMEWDATRGEMVDYIEETKTKIYEGDILFENLSPFDVLYDGTKESGNHDWVVIRRWKNKYDLAAKYPEYAESIKLLETKSDSQKYRLGITSLLDKTDDIEVIEFYHNRTESMPDGRYMMFLSPEIVVQDVAMPYRVLPVFRISCSDIHGTPHGYTPMFDLLPLQEMLNSLYSTVATNQSAFGVQNILCPRGIDINVNQLVGGLNIIDYNATAGKPEPLNLTNTPAEIFKMIDMVKNDMEVLSGVNSVARGQPEASLKSGTALALVQSMALQFMSGLQQSYVELVESTGGAIIKMLQDFANTPRIVAIAGKSNRSYMKEFTSKDISNISRVVVDVGNPLARCLAKDTPVLMFDGSIKMVQDIKINEQLMGPDSRPRTVESLATGKETMYKVVSKDKNRNINYGCNESHILTLKYCSDDERYDAKKGDILDISIRDYNKLTDRQKNLLQGFTTKVEFKTKDLSIPPYILGAWLGDGHSATTALTTMDRELRDSWTDYAHSIDLSVRVQENTQPNKSKVYFITSGQSHGKSDRNSFMNELRSMELINNKHIPQWYKTSDRQDRLELLAGLIDTDGTLVDETFIFTQKSNRLSDDVVYLAKSLGFRVTYKKVKSGSSELVGQLDGECNKITIGGNTWEIPTKLPRKQPKQKEKARDWLNYGIEVLYQGEGTYYGFTLKEEPHFILGDFTVTHNTTAGRVQMADQLLQMNQIDAQQYVNLIHTGNLDSITENIVHENLLMRAENESLLDGETPQAVFTEDHKAHIDSHRTVLFDPDLKKDVNLVTRVQDHIQQHIQLLRTTDPDLLVLMNQQPLQPPPQMPPGPQQGNQGSPPQGPSPADQMSPPEQGIQGPQVVGKSVQGPGLPGPVNLPNTPKVNGNLLSNPAIQQQAMGNVRQH